MGKIIFISLLLLFSVQGLTATENTVTIDLSEEPTEKAVKHSDWWGHNLSQAWYMPEKGSATLGTQVAGYAPTESIFVGFSPWMYTSYNMHNIAIRAANQWMRDNQMSVTTAYFKTGEFYPNKYVMEAVSLWAVKAQEISSNWTAHYNINYMYFQDETIPFSLRREPFNDQPYQVSLTVLNEVRTAKNFGFGMEVGILGVNYTYPHLHVGISARYLTKNWLIQAGVSGSSQARAIGEPYTQAQASSSEEAARRAEIDATYHPEVQIQYHF